MRVALTCAALWLLLVSVCAVAEERQPQYALKTARTLHTDVEIAQARANIEKYPRAKALADQIIKLADEWAAWKDEDLVALITDWRVPRAFDVTAGGCPVCGNKAHEKYGTYPWIVDPKLPFKVKCPVDGTVFPTNNYASYYKSDFKEKKDWDTKYVDDGWGWTSPGGEKFWFVAYYNHWMWNGKLAPGLNALGEAYLLTGDSRYAHKAAVILHRIAEVYPAMDYDKQSRYGQMMAARGIDYPGKVVNAIWETQLARSVAESYDDVWETIDKDTTLQKSVGKTGEQIRSFIEANFLEDAIDAYFQGKIRGNFGMHQSCLVTLGLVRQFGEQDKWFDDLLNHSDRGSGELGLNYALYNLVYRDGFPDESSPGYNALWVDKLFDMGELLSRTGRDLFAQPRLKRLCDAILDQHVIDRFTPCIGDTGSYLGDYIGKNAKAYQIAYRHYHDPRYAWWLNKMGAGGEKGFTSFETLFYPVIEASEQIAHPASRLFDGYGEGILNNPGDSNALSLYYGFKGGHGHFDRLAIDLFAEKAPMMPDLGYPDAMNDFVSGIYTWSKNTISHNTVVVDAKRQIGNVPGVVQMFVDCPFARAMDIEAKETYPQCSSYRRNVIMVDADAEHSYYLDVFTVVGGHEHDYSLHGPPGTFKMIGGEWSEQAEGTLAGKDVPVGKIYDDPEMDTPGYKGGFNRYTGSGFQHLFHVQEHKSGEWLAEWKYKDKPAHLRLRVMDQPGQQVMLCDARVSPIKFPAILKYIIARRMGEDLSSRFVSVIEPFGEEPLIKNVAPLKLESGKGVAVVVERMNGERDLVMYDPEGSAKKVMDEDVVSDAREVVLTFNGDGNVARVFQAGGAYLTYKGARFDSPPVMQGTVVGVDRKKLEIRVKVDGDGAIHPETLVGRVVHFVNDIRRTAHPIAAARMEGNELVLITRDDVMVGRAKIDTVKAGFVTSKTPMPIAATYRGATGTTSDGRISCQIRDLSDGKILFGQVLTTDQAFKSGEDLWLINVGTGDRLDVPSMMYQEGN